MTAAVKSLSSSGTECTVEASTKTGKYLDACNLLFEQGLLSHPQVNNKDSSVLAKHEDTGNQDVTNRSESIIGNLIDKSILLDFTR